jgi:hypothetical protein
LPHPAYLATQFIALALGMIATVLALWLPEPPPHR